jgi:soluble lytic murein transglycosylase-like protein
LSVYWLPPLAAVFIAFLLAAFALNVPNQTSALIAGAPVQASNPSTAAFDLNGAAASSSSGISPIFTRQVQYWGKDIVRWANAASIDPNLLAVVMQIESCGDPRALSRAGAAGLFQVMPFHFQLGENPFNPDTNALRGTSYLSRSLQAANGNARLALAGYNGGIGVISRGEWTWSAETNRYVRFGGPIYEDARSGVPSSPTLEEWYQKYGASLCRQASSRLGISE